MTKCQTGGFGCKTGCRVNSMPGAGFGCHDHMNLLQKGREKGKKPAQERILKVDPDYGRSAYMSQNEANKESGRKQDAG